MFSSTCQCFYLAMRSCWRTGCEGVCSPSCSRFRYSGCTSACVSPLVRMTNCPGEAPNTAWLNPCWGDRLSLLLLLKLGSTSSRINVSWSFSCCSASATTKLTAKKHAVENNRHEIRRRSKELKDSRQYQYAFFYQLFCHLNNYITCANNVDRGYLETMCKTVATDGSHWVVQ